MAGDYFGCNHGFCFHSVLNRIDLILMWMFIFVFVWDFPGCCQKRYLQMGLLFEVGRA